MAKAVRSAGLSAHQVQLAKLLRDVASRHGLWRVFQDFVAMGAIALSNAVDLAHREAREADYMQIVGRYEPREVQLLAQAFAQVVAGLDENGFCDFLGSLYMALELGDAWKGQFFTPYEVARLKAQLTMGSAEALKAKIAEQGFITVHDPCVGGGGLLIAAAQAMQDAGVNYQQHMHATAVDISLTAVHMAYIQFSLFHIPAAVIHGDGLWPEKTWSVWYTPAHVLGFWSPRLSRARDDGKQHAVIAPTPAMKPPASPAAEPPDRRPIDVRDQLALFGTLP